MKHVFLMCTVIFLATIISGCSLRMGSYILRQNNSGLDTYFPKNVNYLETEVQTPGHNHRFGLSWDLGWLLGKNGKTVHYSTEDGLLFYPATTDEIDANMLDTRVTARLYPFKSITIGKKSKWAFSPYVGVGSGYFTGKVKLYSRGDYLGEDVDGNSHYGLHTTTKFDFKGTFWSDLIGIEFREAQSGMFFLTEYRQDRDKKDGTIDLSANQIIVGIGFNW